MLPTRESSRGFVCDSALLLARIRVQFAMADLEEVCKGLQPYRGANRAAGGGLSGKPVDLCAICAIGIIIRTDHLRKIVEFAGPLGFRYYTATARWKRNLGDDSSVLRKLYLEGKRR